VRTFWSARLSRGEDSQTLSRGRALGTSVGSGWIRCKRSSCGCCCAIPVNCWGGASGNMTAQQIGDGYTQDSRIGAEGKHMYSE
jgi:hypothetical protein